jgi:hypothetical protein
MISRPAWYPRVTRHPDYNDEKIILVDANAFSDMAIREHWDDELSFVVNSPASELRIKLNGQVFHETMGAGAMAGMSADGLRRQRQFIDVYRANGKILIDDALVPFFAVGRLTTYHAILKAILATGNISREDAPIVTDAVVNRIPLFTRERRLPQGVAKALNNKLVKAGIKAHLLWERPEQILLRS